MVIKPAEPEAKPVTFRWPDGVTPAIVTVEPAVIGKPVRGCVSDCLRGSRKGNSGDRVDRAICRTVPVEAIRPIENNPRGLRQAAHPRWHGKLDCPSGRARG